MLKNNNVKAMYDKDFEKEMEKTYNEIFSAEAIIKSMNIKDDRQKKAIENLLKKIGD